MVMRWGVLTDVSDLTSPQVSGAKQGARRQSVDPVLVPKQVQHVAVQRGFEVGDIQWVVSV